MKEKLAFAALQALRKLQLKSYELEDWLYQRAFPSEPGSKALFIDRLSLVDTKETSEFFLNFLNTAEDLYGPIR